MLLVIKIQPRKKKNKYLNQVYPGTRVFGVGAQLTRLSKPKLTTW